MNIQITLASLVKNDVGFFQTDEQRSLLSNQLHYVEGYYLGHRWEKEYLCDDKGVIKVVSLHPLCKVKQKKEFTREKGIIYAQVDFDAYNKEIEELTSKMDVINSDILALQDVIDNVVALTPTPEAAAIVTRALTEEIEKKRQSLVPIQKRMDDEHRWFNKRHDCLIRNGLKISE